MKIKWYGHAAFCVVTDRGTKIIVDPYKSGAFNNALRYGPIKDRADIVVVSHGHDDHNYTRQIQGDFLLIHQEGTYDVKDLNIKMLSTYHDASKGKERGQNLISVIRGDHLTLVHLGDLGHSLDSILLRDIGSVDILLLPVGGFFTIDAVEAANVMKAINPMITIPMHYKTEKCDFPIAPVEAFTKGKKNVRILNKSEMAVTKADLPSDAEIVVLVPSL